MTDKPAWTCKSASIPFNSYIRNRDRRWWQVWKPRFVFRERLEGRITISATGEESVVRFTAAHLVLEGDNGGSITAEMRERSA